MTKKHCGHHTPLFADSINGPERVVPCLYCEREQLRGNLSVAKEVLANATQENGQLRKLLREVLDDEFSHSLDEGFTHFRERAEAVLSGRTGEAA